MNLLGSYSGIILAGPTASGKSCLALELVQRLAPFQTAEIINADSMQVYSEASIITARPTEKDYEIVPHHLYGVIQSSEHGSVGWWLSQAEQKIASCLKRNVLPIIVGGTGLYLKALTEGLNFIPKIDEQIRNNVRKLSEQLRENFYSYVCEYDPLVKDRLKVNDHQRLQRALEVFLQTKKSIYAWQEHQSPSKYSFLYCVVSPPKELLYQRINQRFVKMVELGAVEEVKKLQDSGLCINSPLSRAIGIRELDGYVKGKWSLETAIQQAQMNSRRYAKRQLTWFRHQVLKKIVIERPDVNILDTIINNSTQRV